jgi:hypothetical protein
MLTGHVAVAMGAHGIRSSIPLWLLILASQLPDWADAALCTAGIRSAVPGAFSHGFAPIGVLAAAAAIGWFVRSRSAAASLIVAALVITHALGDYVTGTKPTWPGGPMIGLQLYSRPMLDFLFESAIIVAGWLLYRRSFPSDKRNSRYVLMLILALFLIQGAADIILSMSPGLKKC